MRSLIYTTCTIVLTAFLLQGCLKDTCSRTYTMYEPVYKTKAEVRANIKSNSPRAIHNPGKIVLLGNYIFLNEVDKGVHIIDNTNPAAPVNKYFIDIPGNIDIAAKGNILYADLYTDLVTLDISNPAAVQVNKIVDGVFAYRRYANFLADTNNIIVDWIKKDTTVTTECASNWRGRGNVLMAVNNSVSSSGSAAVTTGINGSMARFTLMNDYLYTVTDIALNVFNISTPTNPSFTNAVNIGWGIETIYPFAGNLFIGSSAGMFIYGTSNPNTPTQLGRFAHARACDPVIADGNFAYVTLRSGTTCSGFNNQLDVINVQNLSTPSLVKTYPLTNPHGLSKSGSTLFICDGNGGFKVFNAADVNNIKLFKTITGMDAYDVIASNNIALVVAKDGLYQYNYADAANPVLLSKMSVQ
jgi:hypothetical protein